MALVQQNLGRRPIVWGATAGRSFAGLGDYVVQRGLGFELLPERPDTTSGDLDLHRLTGVPLDVRATERLVFDTYRYGELASRGAEELESTSASVAATLGLPPALLVYAYAGRRDRSRAARGGRTVLQPVREPRPPEPPSKPSWTPSPWTPEVPRNRLPRPCNNRPTSSKFQGYGLPGPPWQPRQGT